MISVLSCYWSLVFTFLSGPFLYTGSALNNAFALFFLFLLFLFSQNASPRSPSQLNEKHCWPLIFHGSITIFNFADKCAIVKPSKVSPTLRMCACVSVCSCVHTVFVCVCECVCVSEFGVLVKGERMCSRNGSWLFARGNFMLQFNYCLNLFLAPEVIASTCNLLQTPTFTLHTHNISMLSCVF